MQEPQPWSAAKMLQENTRSGTPVLAIGEDHVLLGTPVIGRGPLVITPQAPPENPEGSTAVGEREADTRPLENGNLEDSEQGLLTHSAPEEGSPHE